MIRALLLLPAMASALRAGDTLRLLSYNVHHCEGTDGKTSPARIGAYIKAENPDIAFLQEIDRLCTRSGKTDQIAELEKLTGMTAVFAKFMDFQGGAYGQAILTRFPVLESRTVALPPGSEPRTSPVATLKTPFGPLTVAGVHFYETEPQRLAQAQALAGAAGTGRNLILMGDFNSEPGDAVISWLTPQFTLPAKQGPCQATWPSLNPRENIDHIFYRLSGNWKVTSYRVLDETILSDHRPLQCLLQRD